MKAIEEIQQMITTYVKAAYKGCIEGTAAHLASRIEYQVKGYTQTIDDLMDEFNEERYYHLTDGQYRRDN